MTSASTIRSAPPGALPENHHLRLRLKPGGPATGFVDGGWWPRSRDLVAELPALLTELAVRLGPIESVSYNLDAWSPTPRKITLDGRLVRLSGYRSQHPATVDVISAGHRVTLLVVPPEDAPAAAHGALMAAGHRGAADPVDTLLLAGSADHAADADEAAQQWWDLDGGPVRQRPDGKRPARAPRV
jgi:hypothetical protein